MTSLSISGQDVIIPNDLQVNLWHIAVTNGYVSKRWTTKFGPLNDPAKFVRSTIDSFEEKKAKGHKAIVSMVLTDDNHLVSIFKRDLKDNMNYTSECVTFDGCPIGDRSRSIVLSTI